MPRKFKLVRGNANTLCQKAMPMKVEKMEKGKASIFFSRGTRVAMSHHDKKRREG